MPADLTREILEQHHAEAFRWAMSCCHQNAERAEEVMQMVYIAILENKAVYHGESNLRTWLFGVISNMAKRQSRSRGVLERLYRAVFARMADEPEAVPGAARLLEDQDQAARVWSAIGQLSPRQRQIIELVYYRDFSLSEAAGVLGISLGTVRQQFHRAKQALAKQLEPK